MNATDEKKLYSQPSLPLEDKDPYAPSMVKQLLQDPLLFSHLSSITGTATTTRSRTTTAS
jgi:hypothetical protein